MAKAKNIFEKNKSKWRGIITLERQQDVLKITKTNKTPAGDFVKEIQIPTVAVRAIVGMYKLSRISDNDIEELKKCGFPYDSEIWAGVRVKGLEDTDFGYIEKIIK